MQQPGSSDLGTIFGNPLTQHYEGLGFTSEVRECSGPLLQATLVLYKEMQKRFLPSAVRFHYGFTTRDLASLVNGLLLATPGLYRSSLGVLRLWYHESTRVFSDRLITPLENTQCAALIQDVARRHFGDYVNFEELFATPCNFTHFCTPSIDTVVDADHHHHIGMYLPAADDDTLRLVLEEKLLEHNEENVVMDLVLFKEACEHICRCARVLARPKGHFLMIGVGGSGKRSLAHLASFVCDYAVVQMSSKVGSGGLSGKGYGVSDLKEELKQVYMYAGVRPAEPLVFLVTDNLIDNEEKLLVAINDLLASGDIPNLFTHEEIDSILTTLRPVARTEGVSRCKYIIISYVI
jgi:dynein heavy chain, axonemal